VHELDCITKKPPHDLLHIIIWKVKCVLVTCKAGTKGE